MRISSTGRWAATMYSYGILACGVFVPTGCSDTPATLQPVTNVRQDEPRSSLVDPAFDSMQSPSDSWDANARAPLAVAERRQAAGDLEGALRVLQEAYRTQALDLNELLQLVRLNQAIAFRRADAMDGAAAREAFLDTGRLAKEIVERFPQLAPGEAETVALALYNAACSSAVAAQPTDAVEYLALAVDFGYANFEELEQDPDLDSLRPLESFQSLRDRLHVVYRSQIELSIRRRAAELCQFDFEFAGRDLDGRMVRSTDFRGRPAVVFFWMSGFPPCREQARHLVKLRHRLEEHSLAVVGLAYDRFTPDDDPEAVAATVRRTMTSLACDFPCLLGDEPTKKRIPNFVGYPSLLFLDRDGVPRLLLSGLEGRETVDAAIEWIAEQPAAR